MSCTKTWVCLEMTPASLQLQKRCDRETEDHRAKTLNASAYPFIEISSQLKMQITRNVWVRKQTITFWFWFLSLNLTLPTQRALPARLLGLCVRGEPAWNHFFKFLWPKRKKTPAVLVWMHADKAQKPQQLPTLKAVFSVYTGKFSLQLTRLLFSFFFSSGKLANTIQVQNIQLVHGKKVQRDQFTPSSFSISVDGVGTTLPLSHRPLKCTPKIPQKITLNGQTTFPTYLYSK